MAVDNRRITGLRARMGEAGIDAVLLLHHRDVLYYAGTSRPTTLLVTAAESVLFARRGLDQVRQESKGVRVTTATGFSSIAAALVEMGLTGGALGTELDVIPVRLGQRLQETFSSWTLVDVSPLVLAQRAVKDEVEVAATRRAAKLADVGHRAVPGIAAPGVSELVVAAEVEAAMRRAGHELGQSIRHPDAVGPGVMVMSGANLAVRGGYGLVVTGSGLSPAMPYGPSARRLEPGDLVVVDIGSMLDGYTGDTSRTFVVGEAADWQRALLEVVRGAEDAVLAALRSGVASGKLFAAAAAVVERAAAPHFASGDLTLPDFVGHGIGLEMDEPPVLAAGGEVRLLAGMVLAVEIEVSSVRRQTMAKLEDTVVVLDGGCEVLTRSPRRLLECPE